jgi:hypothetical protein
MYHRKLQNLSKVNKLNKKSFNSTFLGDAHPREIDLVAGHYFVQQVSINGILVLLKSPRNNFI